AEDVVTNWFGARPQDPGPTGHHVRHYPTGSLDVVVPAGGKVNTPLVLCQLESHNWEEGGSADSARLLQEYYGFGDSLISVDSTSWFPFVDDTTWRFLSGQGKYGLYAQYLDVPNEVSPPYTDFVDTLVVFDTTAATGSISTDEAGRLDFTPVEV
ncbi:MAG: hypothetical protein NTX53_21130, partial [candidate division WOR-3 bacterium]|nr:hypothetical protein [candidate division WOR-3 bacterium]